MNWRTKARLQNWVARLPAFAAEPLYYQLQRRFGALRSIDPRVYLRNTARIARTLAENGFPIDGKTVFELGTGRTFASPIAMWLLGAAQITTVDLNPYLRSELVLKVVAWIRENPLEVAKILGGISDAEQLQHRIGLLSAEQPLENSLRDLCRIVYRAPLDAANTGLPSESVDIYYSTNVLEHIPPAVIRGLFREASRVLRPNIGVMAHYIDLRDHFQAVDKSISLINFLRFSEDEWRDISGNRFMYQNRLRLPEYTSLVSEAGFDTKALIPEVDEASLGLLRAGFPVHQRFSGIPEDQLATVGMTVLCTRPTHIADQ